MNVSPEDFRERTLKNGCAVCGDKQFRNMGHKGVIAIYFGKNSEMIGVCSSCQDWLHGVKRYPKQFRKLLAFLRDKEGMKL